MTEQRPTGAELVHLQGRSGRAYIAQCEPRAANLRLTVYPALVTCPACIALFTKDEQASAAGRDAYDNGCQ